MQIKVKVMPKSSCNKIVYENGIFKIKVTDAPEKGKANHKIIKLLAREFNVAKSNIEIIKGLTGRNKIVKIKSDK